jgi:hypothetical protein
MKNKEVINKLVKYLIDQDKAVLCRVLANQMLDLYRLQHISELPEQEVTCLYKRQELNSLCLLEFIKNGPNGPLTFSE